jgi:PAS domain S-box-containing protein
MEIDLFNKDNKNIQCLYSGQYVTVHGIKRILSIAVDITDRKRAEKSLQLANIYNRGLIEASLDPLVTTSPDGKITDVNDATIAATGYSRSELIGSDFCNYFNDPERARSVYQQAFQFGVVQNYELNIRHKKGQIMPVLYNATVRRSEDGDIVGVFAVARDITEFRRIEEQRLVMSKLESTGILAGGIAHDFNNLLAAMVGNLEMARSLAVPRGEIDEHLAAAEKAAWDARSLTQQLITLAKGGAPLRKPISLSGLLKEQVALTLRGSSVNSEISVPSDLWQVEVDDGQIGQVIRNLVLNAREAMPAGGMVRVTAENQVLNGETDISLHDGNYVTVSITDQGGGIAEEILPNIFDPYFSTKQRGEEKGMGLGLTICQSIVLKHGGRIRVSSKAGIGTTFSIDLPASDKPVQEEKRKAPAVQSGGGRILLMDDEEGLRNLYAAALKKSGYDVSLAGNGEAAIDLYKEAMAQGRPFDAVVLDLTVRGGMGGLDAIRSLLVVDPDVRAVVSSGYADDPAMMDHERYGFKGVLAKPFGIAELREVLSRVRKQREMTHE